ncbi:c-type cytochrome [Winogradskyella sp. A3E31]|uniref:c-type cytochrome n=1 Tax=Winogradskyella sp. A3E31 TaxID=3349637 RepID=UPI00398A579C
MKYIISLISCIAIVFLISDCQNSNATTPVEQNKQLEKSIAQGKDIYNDFCMSCHLPSGEGIKNIYPPLANSDYLKENRMESIKGVKYGQQGKIIVNGKTYNNVMTPMGLTDEEVADVMNYINHSWGNNYGEIVTVDEVSKIKK